MEARSARPLDVVLHGVPDHEAPLRSDLQDVAGSQEGTCVGFGCRKLGRGDERDTEVGQMRPVHLSLLVFGMAVGQNPDDQAPGTCFHQGLAGIVEGPPGGLVLAPVVLEGSIRRFLPGWKAGEESVHPTATLRLSSELSGLVPLVEGALQLHPARLEHVQRIREPGPWGPPGQRPAGRAPMVQERVIKVEENGLDRPGRPDHRLGEAEKQLPADIPLREAVEGPSAVLDVQRLVINRHTTLEHGCQSAFEC